MLLQNLPSAAQWYVRLVIGVGAAGILAVALTRPLYGSLELLGTMVVAALLASQKLVLVGGPAGESSRTHRMSTLSLGFPAVFASLLWFGPEEGMLVGLASGIGASLYPRRHPAYRLAFTSVSLGLTAFTSGFVMRDLGAMPGMAQTAGPFTLLAGTLVYYLLNTATVSIAVALSQRAPIWAVWRAGYLWTAPSYLTGAAVVAGAFYLQRLSGATVAGLLLLCLYLVHLSAKCYLEKVQQLQVNEKRLEEVCLAAVESLALAIDARDSGTHSHIRRVQQIAVALGEQLELSPDELQAVRVASLTHDVGKLAVPDTILGKAGPLTPAEFERVKTHVEVGARILEPVQFPWPVIEIVRAHHERWDGQGYPEGLKGEAIPLGGRIVSLADMFDALTSPRPYRDPLSYDEAHAAVCAESGTRFDPRVVDAFTAIFPTLVAALKATDTGARRGLESCGRSEPAWGYVWDEIRGASREALSLAFTDPLTGLANARHLEAALHRAVHEARRDGGTLALLMIDLDGFKAINDGFGHLAGDAALQMVARVLSAELREGTTVCRYAGDEFVVLLSGCTRERAERVADRLRQRVSACLVPGTTCRVSLSVGLACFPEDATDVRALLAAADGQMYAEKSQRKPAAHSSVA